MKGIVQVTVGLVGLVLTGCMPVHLFPSYKGRVLELSTNKPIEGAGVLMVYMGIVVKGIESDTISCGYQAAVTDHDGTFHVPSKWSFYAKPLSWCRPEPRITVYKHGYGNLPGSSQRTYSWFNSSGHYETNKTLAKVAVIDPDLPRDRIHNLDVRLPAWGTATIWLPKLESPEEIQLHNSLLPHGVRYWAERSGFPPPGMNREQFADEKE
ncbi:MAG: hypothetical protein HZB43_12675 [candidate division Zixibacteria bacterium]|nr:hypothetical protein [candidate division Zixibacteria bacterium]